MELWNTSIIRQWKQFRCVYPDKSPVLMVEPAKYGIKVIYLPAYSPDLDPIEKFWANLKRNIRKVIKTSENLRDVITTAFQIILSC